MATIKVTSNIDAVVATLSKLERKVIDPAANTAINKSLADTGKKLLNNMTALTGIKKGDLKRRMKVYKASKRYPSGLIWFSLNPFPVHRIGKSRQTKTGVRTKGKSYDSAFISTMPSGHTGVFRRKGDSRLPIKEVTVNVSAPYRTAERRLSALANRTFEKHFKLEVERRLTKLRKV